MSLFITFEGIDGSGKSSQIRLAEQFLKQRGVPVLVAREPGGTPVGESIRQVLLDSRTTQLLPISELLLYYASRHQNLLLNILPALDKGVWVLCDRFADASMAYQGYGRGIDLGVIRVLNQITIPTMPDVTVLLDLDPFVGLPRARSRNSQNKVDEGRFEKESLEFYQRVRQGYLQIAQEEPKRVRVVDGNQPIETVHQEIVELLSPLIDRHGIR